MNFFDYVEYKTGYHLLKRFLQIGLILACLLYLYEGLFVNVWALGDFAIASIIVLFLWFLKFTPKQKATPLKEANT